MFYKIFFPLMIVLIVALVSGCNLNNEERTGSSSWDKQNLRSFNSYDTAYFNAIDEARENIHLFTAYYNDKNNNKYEYYVKSKFVENDHIEHMWLVVDRLRNDTIIGILDNKPDKLKMVKYKDTIKINKVDIEDWIIFKGDSIILGNYISNAVDQ